MQQKKNWQKKAPEIHFNTSEFNCSVETSTSCRLPENFYSTLGKILGAVWELPAK